MQYLDPYTFGLIAAEAGVGQALNTPRGYGQGAGGYFQRYGADFADGLTNSVFNTGVYPSLLRQDPRFYRRGDGPLFHRARYALSRVLITRRDSGRQAINLSEIMGSLTSGAISTAYYPRDQRDFSHVAERAGVQLGVDAGVDLVREFYPDIMRRIFHRKPKN